MNRPLTNELDNKYNYNNNLKMSEATGGGVTTSNSIKGVHESAPVNLGSGEDTSTSTASKKP